MGRQEVLLRVHATKHRDDCQDIKRMAPDVTVQMWFSPPGSCELIEPKPEVRLVNVGVNRGYFSIDVQYTIVSRNGAALISEPVSGALFIQAPDVDDDFAFNWDERWVTAVKSGRKDDCYISWAFEKTPPVITQVQIVTR